MSTKAHQLVAMILADHPCCNAYGHDPQCVKHKIDAAITELEECIGMLEDKLTNALSTIAAWDHAAIMKCGCKYSRVWGGTKWEHWLVPCPGHTQQLKGKQL